MDNKKSLINNIKKKNISRTTFGDSIYKYLWYVDDDNKICMTFSPRGGCTISFQQYLDLVGLLKDGLNYDPFIHKYRTDILIKNIPIVNIESLIQKKYVFIKFIMNPYIRAVSIFRAQSSHNLSFREYLKQLVNNQVDYFNSNDQFHYKQQYIDGEEKIITKYIRINENETYNIKLKNNKNYLIDPNKYTSCHHGKKNSENTTFCGDIPKNTINSNLPKSYKYFYDEEIKTLVDTYYKNDIEKYKFSFDNF